MLVCQRCSTQYTDETGACAPCGYAFTPRDHFPNLTHMADARRWAYAPPTAEEYRAAWTVGMCLLCGRRPPQGLLRRVVNELSRPLHDDFGDWKKTCVGCGSRFCRDCYEGRAPWVTEGFLVESRTFVCLYCKVARTELVRETPSY